jgi:p21-activated kinase 1
LAISLLTRQANKSGPSVSAGESPASAALPSLDETPKLEAIATEIPAESPAKSEPATITPTAAPAPASQVRQRAPTNTDASGDEFIKKLERLVNPADPLKLYRNLVKIGQGCVYLL